jgi:pimeloyl-ACP methyl ester carboxylesterase/DNA-binding CsgD family transcriptional regulator
MEQQVRFCSSEDGVRLAYALHGRGPAIVKVANWLTHLEHDWQSPVWRHWLAELGRGHTFVRYDCRGCGLSDRTPSRVALEAQVADLAAVVDAAGLERFALLGISAGGAVAVAYAAKHPQRVSHLILWGAYAQGRLQRNPSHEEREEAELLESVVRVGWGNPDPLFRRVFTSRFLPGATTTQMEWFDELQRISTSPEMAVRLRKAWAEIDVTSLLGRISAPTLVAHVRDDVVTPFDQGRLIATRIPEARFLPLAGGNHLPLADDPAWPAFLEEARRFLGTSAGPELTGLDELSSREVEILRLVAHGLSNQMIAERLVVSVRTVERHLSNIYVKRGLSGKAARAAAAAQISHLEAP